VFVSPLACLFLLPQGLPPRPPVKTPGLIAPVSKPAPPTNPAPSKPPLMRLSVLALPVDNPGIIPRNLVSVFA